MVRLKGFIILVEGLIDIWDLKKINRQTQSHEQEHVDKSARKTKKEVEIDKQTCHVLKILVLFSFPYHKIYMNIDINL